MGTAQQFLVFFVPGDLDFGPLTLTFKLFRARDQTRLHCEFGANLFSGSRFEAHANKQGRITYRREGDDGSA